MCARIEAVTATITTAATLKWQANRKKAHNSGKLFQTIPTAMSHEYSHFVVVFVSSFN